MTKHPRASSAKIRPVGSDSSLEQRGTSRGQLNIQQAGHAAGFQDPDASFSGELAVGAGPRRGLVPCSGVSGAASLCVGCTATCAKGL